MENNIKHPDKVVGYDGSLDQLAQAVGNMTYDQVALFFALLSQDISRQAEADLSRGRRKLSKALSDVAQNLDQSRKSMALVWKICQPHMPAKS